MATKRTKKLLRRARELGLVVANGPKHFKVLRPDGRLVTVLPHGTKHEEIPERRDLALRDIEAAGKEVRRRGA